MERVHGVDVSWMTQGSTKDKINKTATPVKTPAPAQPRQVPSPVPDAPSPTSKEFNGNGASPKTNGHNTDPAAAPAAQPASIPRRLSRSGSIERQNGGNSPSGSPLQRRGSWFSNISSKFSSSSSPPSNLPQPQQQQKQHPQSLQNGQQPGQAQPETPQADGEPLAPKISPPRSAVLPHAAKANGTGPYTPAPPKSGQAGFLGGVLRRLSSSGANSGAVPKMSNGLVERRILNIDQMRERCPISELKDSKLRRVAFCVDVEIAPMPRYSDGEVLQAKPVDRTQRKKMTEKGEGEALKNPKAAEEGKENVDKNGTPAEKDTSKPEVVEASEPVPAPIELPVVENGPEALPIDKDKETTRKKEKKKKSEEERKARKEKKRKLAEANGSIPMEIYYDSSDASSTEAVSTPKSGTRSPKTSTHPTTNPVRIYRRCCQLRESPILKKITEQLNDAANFSAETGLVDKLDLTGYWLQLPDLVTLGDYLAVVPVRELIMENCGMSDEGLRVILAGLLAARQLEKRRRKPRHELEPQGGVVERLVLKNNKLGPDGWKHLSLFLYLCRTLKYLDVSHIPFPKQSTAKNVALPNGMQIPLTISDIFSKALAKRPGGSTLELVNLGETEPSMEQLGTIIDGIIQCGVRRLGLAHNYLDTDGVAHVSRYLTSGHCEGLDLGGNDLHEHAETIAASMTEASPLAALSLAGSELTPSSLSKVLPQLAKLPSFRFVDLSHNHQLFEATPSAVGMLRRWLPKMASLKRIHLQDGNMTSEQAIALIEVLPEVHGLAHISLTENAEIVKLAQAKTEEAQEEACALFASLLAAARVSKSLICADIEVPSDDAGEIVKAMAKQVVAYCLRNLERIPEADLGAFRPGEGPNSDYKTAEYNDVLSHLVGHDAMIQGDSDDNASAPDEDYVIGGTGVVKALTCCLANRGEELSRQSGEFIRDQDGGAASPVADLATGRKAKDMSKHLLAGARKIRRRLQPALMKAKAESNDEQVLRKLVFLDDTLKGIIRRFEDEYPDTRLDADADGEDDERTEAPLEEVLSTTPPTGEDPSAILSDVEDEGEIHVSRPLSRSNSMLSRTLAEEEGRALRSGHRFRSGVLRQEHVDVINAIDEIAGDPKQARILTDLAEDIGGELLARVRSRGVTEAFGDRDLVFQSMKSGDPENWEHFLESQRKARANISVSAGKPEGDESAIAD